MKKASTPLLFLLPLLVFLLTGISVKAQVSVVATAGTTGPTAYTTLKGAFDAVNAGTHQGNITISITGNTTEPSTATLNASGSGSASYSTVTVKPGSGATPTISGGITSGPVVRLNGSNNVTIDGSNSGTTSRNLTITNTSGTSSNVLQIGSVGTTPINNITVKNSVLINGTNTSTAVVVGDASVVGNPGYFFNITLQNNSIQKAYIGLYLYAVVSALDNNTVISGNDLNSAGTNALRLVGIYGQGIDGLTISNNNIGNFSGTEAEFDRAIWLATATKNTTVSGNTISGLNYTGTSSYAPIGINVSPGITNSNISVTGNTVTNMSSSGTGTTMGMFIYSALSGVTISKNKVSNIKNANTSGYGAAGILCAPTTSTSTISINNNFVWDVTGYGYNDYTSADNGNGIVLDGTGIYNVYFNTVVLNTEQTLTGAHRASCLLITANVTNSGAVNLRDNILANLQTVGNANSRLVISNLSGQGTAVFGAINNNNYYATSTNLSSTGTNASITNTLAQLQTSLGGNANSSVVQPVLLGANDLHLSPANPGLSNTGVPLAGITTDIDGTTRNATTPDMGADEFAPCPVTVITTQPTNGAVCAGNDTSFTVASSNGTLFQWQVNTGSGFTDITNNTIYGGATTPTLTLTGVPATYGGYIYRCVVNFFTGCTATNSNPATLSINPQPVALITPASSTALCPGGSVTLNANSGGFTYIWQKNGTNIAPPATSAAYNASTAGSYTVIITNSSTTCRDTSDPVSVIINPTITATQNLTICTNQLPYTWNGQSIAAPGTAVATYMTPSLVTGCDSTTTLNLTTNAVVSAIQNITICANQLPYTWHGHVISSGGTAVATDTTLSAAGCDSITTLNLTVNPLLTATKSLTICQNQLPYTWNGIIVSAGGTAVATYTTASLVTGCDSTTTLNLTVNPNPSIAATPLNPSLCSGTATSIALSSTTSGASISWTVTQTGASGASAGSGASIAQTLTATGSAPGKTVYAITSTANGCSSAVLRDTVTVNPIPSATATPASQTICSGTPTNINLTSAVSGATFSWTVTQTNASGAAAGNGTNIGQTLTATGTAAGTVAYTVTPAANGCNGSNITVNVTVNPVPQAPVSITGSSAPCVGSTQTYSIASVTGATGYVWSLPPGWTGTSTTNSISVTVGSSAGNVSVMASNSCGNSPATTKAVNPIPVVTPSVIISHDAPSLLCSGTQVTFTAAGTNGGAAPVYQWRVNGNVVGSNNTTYTYVPSDGDTVSCRLTSNAPCVTAAQANSNQVIMQVTPSLSTALNIYVIENHICSDTPVTFLATPTNGGANPAYQWKVNNTNVGTNSVNYTYLPSNGDIVTCHMTSNAVCATPATVTSNTVPMSIIMVSHPEVTITSSPAGNIATGQPVTFTAHPVDGGPGAQILWYKNNVNIPGASGTTWTAIAGTDIANGAKVKARLQSFSPCALPDSAWSNVITVSIGTTGIDEHTLPEGFSIYPNPATGIVNIEGLKAGDELVLYDALGHRLVSRTIQKSGIQQLDMSTYAQGMYWFHFSNAKGQHWQAKVTRR